MYYRLRSLLMLTLVISSFFFSHAHASGVITTSLAPMLEKVLPAIVNIRAQVKITDLTLLSKLEKSRKNNTDTIPNQALSSGSGVIVNANKGYILTNAHVIEGAQTITVTLNDGRHYTAKVIGTDKLSDIALIQIQAKNLTEVPIADSSTLKVGDFVAAIGSPFGLNQSVTSGIVSALGRTTLGIENYENFIQTDAPINPGNSGGALVNTTGQLVGINTAVVAPGQGTGIGFAIPVSIINSVMNQLIQFGNVQRGMLGVGAQDLAPELASAINTTATKGAIVTQVIPSSPAAKAGIQIGDIISRVNNIDIRNANDLVNAIGFLRVNSKATVDLLRKNKTLSMNVNLYDVKKRQEISQSADPFLYGLSLKNFSILSPIHGQVNGILVVSVDEDSNAWHANIIPGDVITSANEQTVTNVEDLWK